MAEGEQKRFLITPPPGLIPETANKDAAGAADPPATPSPDDRISMPPRFGDSGTVRLSSPPRVTAPVAPPTPVEPAQSVPASAATSAPSSPPRFFPAVPGVPVQATAAATPVAAPHPSITLELADGARVRCEHAIVIGRDPVAPATFAEAVRTAVLDPEKSVSKTHAVVVLDDDGAWVHDLHSTNGVAVTRPDGRGETLGSGGRAAIEVGDSIHLGSFRIRILAS